MDAKSLPFKKRKHASSNGVDDEEMSDSKVIPRPTTIMSDECTTSGSLIGVLDPKDVDDQKYLPLKKRRRLISYCKINNRQEKIELRNKVGEGFAVGHIHVSRCLKDDDDDEEGEFDGAMDLEESVGSNAVHVQVDEEYECSSRCCCCSSSSEAEEASSSSAVVEERIHEPDGHGGRRVDCGGFIKEFDDDDDDDVDVVDHPRAVFEFPDCHCGQCDSCLRRN